MARTKGTYSVTSNFEPKVGAPLDARTVVKLTADLTAVGTFPYPYEGMTVYCEEDNKKYTLIGADPTVAANWHEEISDASDFQTKTMSESVVVDESTKTTVEGSIGGLADLLNALGLCVRNNKICQKIDADVYDVWGFIEHQDILDPIQRIEYVGKNASYDPIVFDASGVITLGDWSSFPLLAANKPYMVKADGTADYQLSETDYSKKADGVTASEVSDTTYAGAGAYAWLPKIYRYKYEVGNDVYTFFSMTQKNANYTPDGFIDGEGNELKGLWIPMFFGTEVTQNGVVKLVSIGSGAPVQSKTADQQKTEMENACSRARFVGGPLPSIIDDLLIMLGGSVDVQQTFGYGNRSGGAQASNMKSNALINGGAFYAKYDSQSYGKVFHSLVFTTYNQGVRDPYLFVNKGYMFVSKNYSYSKTGEGYTDTGLTFTVNAGWHYPDKNHMVPGYGLLPVEPYNGSTITGNCAGIYKNNAYSNNCGIRYGSCGNGATAGQRYLQTNWGFDRSTWDVGASPIILPPANYSPT